MRDEGEWNGGNGAVQWQRRSPIQQHFNEFHHQGNREGRSKAQQTFVDPYHTNGQEERMEGRVLQLAQQNWGRPFHEDRGYGGDQQGGYGGYGGD
jgi:hypothetical protein